LQDGHCLPYARSDETAHVKEYNIIADGARKTGKGIWDTNRCGKGPAASLTLAIRFHGNGNTKKEKLNDEYVLIRNVGTKAVNLKGWSLRTDLFVNTLKIKKSTVIQPGKALYVRNGVGKNTAGNIHWNLKNGLFTLPNYKTGAGNAVYLKDKLGNYRFWAVYPCAVDCKNPADTLKISRVGYSAPLGSDFIEMMNAGLTPIDLSHFIVYAGTTKSRPFPIGSSIGSGETYRLRFSATGANTRLDQSWGPGFPNLVNSGGVLRIATFDDITVDCAAWGKKSCPVRS